MLVLAQVLKSNIPHRLGSIENCNQLLPAFDFLYEIIPFAIFDNYLVKHNNITQNEFGKYKQGLDLKKDIKTLNNEGNNSLESSNNKKDNGTAAKKKSDKKKLEQEIKIDKNPITKFFKKK